MPPAYSLFSAVSNPQRGGQEILERRTSNSQRRTPNIEHRSGRAKAPSLSQLGAQFPPLIVSEESKPQSERNQGRQHAQRQNTYGWLDKLTTLTLPDGSKATHTYWPDGQLAAISSSPNQNSKINNLSRQSGAATDQSSISSPSESFLWDNLALLKRNDTVYIIESHPSGGIPIASHPVGKPEEITYHLNKWGQAAQINIQ